MELSKFEAARRVSGMTNQGCMETCGFTRPTMNERGDNPASWRLGELHKVYRELSDLGKPILLDAVVEFLCSED